MPLCLAQQGITLSEFERLEAERLLAPKKLEETPVKFVAIDHDTSSAFISYCRLVCTSYVQRLITDRRVCLC
eukprot:SAG31_NODE_711_length_12665_cov_2.283225_2_plen_72_part_00